MKRLLLMMPLLMSCVATGSSQLEDIAELRWEKRVFVIHSGEPKDVIALLKQNSYEIDDRHITWFVISDGQLQSNHVGEISSSFTRTALNDYFDSDYGVVLIGKDGGIKHRQNELELNTLFNKIDAMPMRRSEMRSREI
ncbi:serine-threonine protein phosphatase [Vibrio ishigakensis]|uniref:Serine-threonine protein phosphatase n=1 Tax=Vibrio ishigakensis TaxID=1481914 RepID=A0A0B8QBJ4_9VIBR|nr:serine-threonine protein phosphatase [Vibrio ishigakensis]